MKRIKVLFLTLILSLFILPLSVNASTGDYFHGGNSLDFDGSYNHNVFVGANKLNEKGNTKGILFAGANKLNSNSKMEYGVIGGNEVNISSVVENDLFVMGNDVLVSDATIGRDLYIAGNTLEIKDTTIDGNVFLGGTKLVLENVKIVGQANIAVDNLVIGDNVEMSELVYNSNAEIDDLKKLDCRLTPYEVKEAEQKTTKKDVYLEMAISAAALILIAMLVSTIYSKSYRKVNEGLTIGGIFKYLGLGILVLIAVPIISILLIASSIGTPLGLIILGVYFAALYLSLLWMGMAFGKLLHIKNSFVGTLLGVIIVKGLTYIPYAGGVFFALFMIIGMGLTLRVIKPTRKEKEDKNENESTTNTTVVVEEPKVEEVKEEKVEEVVKEEMVPVVVPTVVEKPSKKASTAKKTVKKDKPATKAKSSTTKKSTSKTATNTKTTSKK